VVTLLWKVSSFASKIMVKFHIQKKIKWPSYSGVKNKTSKVNDLGVSHRAQKPE
jgi:hypothetical protein